ncbi:MAG: hypothetical protein LBR41_01865 [Rickettsiales bacterium]|jgi:glycerophosphoryl diester phosphodiesterase|nr:hypothetical protein [Rickettsiales bacterium]
MNAKQKLESSSKLIFAHRGASVVQPENTLAAFRAAPQMGADGVELDVHLTRDGHIVVIHDYEINRTARQKLDASVSVEDLTLRQLRKYDFGNGEKIPTLKQVMNLVGPNILVDIEIKANLGKPYKELCAALALFLSERGNIDNVFVSSFNPFALNEFRRATRKLKINVPTALIYADLPDVPKWLWHRRGRFIHNPDIYKPYYKDVRRIGHRPMLTWTVDDANVARDLFAQNITGVITNVPDKILKVR